MLLFSFFVFFHCAVRGIMSEMRGQGGHRLISWLRKWGDVGKKCLVVTTMTTATRTCLRMPAQMLTVNELGGGNNDDNDDEVSGKYFSFISSRLCSLGGKCGGASFDDRQEVRADDVFALDPTHAVDGAFGWPCSSTSRPPYRLCCLITTIS